MEEIAITTETIQLDQLLKYAGIIESGGQVKFLVNDGLITLNGVQVTERRKKIKPGDIVAIDGMGKWKVILE